MEFLSPLVGKLTEEYGLVGLLLSIIIVGLFVVIGVLWKDNRSKEQRIFKLHVDLLGVYRDVNSRLLEALRDNTDVIEAASVATMVKEEVLDRLLQVLSGQDRT